MAKSKTIYVVWDDGDPEGYRHTEMPGSSTRVYAFPRQELVGKRLQTVLQRPGAYILIGKVDDSSDPKEIYIGESNSLDTRLGPHSRGKGNLPLWENAYVIFSNDESFTKTHASHLENMLIQTNLL